jgi:hypothetical protein
MKKKIVFFFILLLVKLNSCSLQKPTAIDATSAIKLVVIDTTGISPVDSVIGIAPVRQARVRLFSTEYGKPLDFWTDERGEVSAADMLASHYRIAVDKRITAEEMFQARQVFKEGMLKGSLEADVVAADFSRADTIKMDLSILSSIVINEVYYCGPANSGLYYSDQFVELYNESDKTQYLDSLILCRASQTPDYIGQFCEVYYAYQFPGNGTDYQIEPGELVVVAQDAMDHVKVGGAAGSIDLSSADWECYNQLGNDLDNPNVPNLININPNKKVDFMFGLSGNGVVLAKVTDHSQFVFNDKGYILFNFEDVLDGVEYAANSDASKEMDPRLDAGFAGKGIQKYSGKSTERENPETGAAGYDTNNSTFDFVSIYRPTPGYQHAAGDVIPKKH